jgi:hypothetical protein
LDPTEESIAATSSGQAARPCYDFVRFPLAAALSPHHPGPLLPASPPDRREKRESKRLLSPSLPADGREAGREGLGSEGSGGGIDDEAGQSDNIELCVAIEGETIEGKSIAHGLL